MAGASLPPGFRFHPTDVELIMYYLKRKVMGKKLHAKAIAEVNIYKFSPWDLPDKSCLRSKDLEWFFFCPREKKYASGVRVKRATENGYWKTTGKDRHVHYNDKTVGTVKTLVFHLGHAPQGQRTDWVMHEYVILDDNLAAAGVQDTYVLCKLFKKNGPGPKNGAQYGAPFNEDDWADNDVDVDDAHHYFISSIPNGQSLTPLLQSSPTEGLFDPGSTSGPSKIKEGPNEKINSVSTQLCDPGNTSWFSEGLSPSAGPSTKEVESDDEIVRLLASFTDESMLLFNENGNHKDDRSSKMLPCLDGYDIYNGLEDLHNGVLMNETRVDFSGMQNNGYPHNNILLENNLSYLELNDLLAPLDCSAEVNGTDQLCNGIFGSYSLENMLPLCSCEGQLHVLPNDSNKEDGSLDVIETVRPNFNFSIPNKLQLLYYRIHGN
ncbi:hypothetical protein ACJIZ3_000127 [Penstemon smallii]|uniref:NAC domain-containing protein n=1 Tax=Penstemon smallii TaxID=265156 RepID=A0ABD3R9B7_9LAMI